MSTYYHTCPYCGANLDPGETCDCIESTRGVYTAFIRKSMQQGRVSAILRPLCQRALDDPSTPADTLHALCSSIKEAGN